MAGISFARTRLADGIPSCSSTFLSPPALFRPGRDREHRRDGQRLERSSRSRRTGHDPRGQPEHDHDARDRRERRLYRAVPGARDLRGAGGAPGIQDLDPSRHHPAGHRPRARRRGAGSGHDQRGHHGGRECPGRAHRFLGSRHGHRGDGDQGTAAERPELRHARVPGTGDHAGPGGREPLRREHLQPARRRQLQCARVAGELQRVDDRRHRQQRVHVQHLHRHAIGRAGA